MTAQVRSLPKAAARESLSDRIRPHLPAFAKRAATTEAARTVPAESIAAIVEAGFMRALLPAPLGGDERDLWDFCEGVRIVSKACPSTGWVAGVLNVHPAALCHFDRSVQQEMLATGPDTISCSSGSPVMKAKLADGGIVVSGRGRFSSGCDHAEWAMVGVKVPDTSDAAYPERKFRDFLFMAHRSEYVIDDTWYTAGLRGTGSKDLVFDKLFVPFRRMERMDGIMFNYSHGAGTVDSWLSRVPFPMVFQTFMPAVALGCADGMIEEFTKRQQTRKNVLTGAQGILNAAHYMRLAESTHELEALSVYYRHLVETIQRHGEQGSRLTEENFLSMQTKIPFLTRRAIHLIDRLMEAAGASSMADFNPMQRYWRDAHTAGLHVASDYDVSLQQHGRFLVGLGPTPDL
jgi:alkylation response protein AidB-like acyl-CoA dehydrogenase